MVDLIAPANVVHPPDYDPKPSDLAKVARADFVLYADFEGFAPRLKDAAGSSAKLVSVNLENTPAGIHKEVARLGQALGTAAAATAWLNKFDAEYARLSGEVKGKLPNPAPTAVAHMFMAYWTDFAGVKLVGTWGPAAIKPSEAAQLASQNPKLVFDNAHESTGQVLAGNPARQIEIVNYPQTDFDLLWVFKENARRIEAAL